MKKAVSTATAMALSMMVGLMGVNVNVNASAYEAGRKLRWGFHHNAEHKE